MLDRNMEKAIRPPSLGFARDEFRRPPQGYYRQRREWLVDKAGRKRIRHLNEIVLLCGAAVGWLYVIVNGRRQREPMVVVKKHFLFYPEYSHGVWREGRAGNPRLQRRDAAK